MNQPSERPPRRERFNIPEPARGDRSFGDSRYENYDQYDGYDERGYRIAEREESIGRERRYEPGRFDSRRFDSRRQAQHRSAQHRSPAKQSDSGVQKWHFGVIGVFLLVTVLVLANALSGGSDSDNADQAENASVQGESSQDGEQAASRGDGPVPGRANESDFKTGDLPPGGSFAEKSSGNYTLAGKPGSKVGEGKKDHYTYVVEIEDTIDVSASGGADAFAAMVDATLSNPKSWIADKDIAFEHVDESKLPAGEEPDLRVQLSSTETTHDVCGYSYKLETSCFMPIGNRVVLNDSRWVRGALPFHGDLGLYRQYLINHEVGHGIGYAAHQACHENGALAPVMMQQTISLNNGELNKINTDGSYDQEDISCLANPWPYPTGSPEPDTETENGIRNDS